MPLTRTEAQDALRDISVTGRASAAAYGYHRFSPHLIVWGLIWFVGYGANYLRPQWSLIWPVLVVIGTAASFGLGAKAKSASSKEYDWRFAATVLAIFLFIAAVFAVMPPRNQAQLGAFFPILVALFYGLVGIWTRGARIWLAGLVVGALTLAGFFLLPQYFLLWMAAVGGGALLLGGLWLRSV